MRVHRAWDVWEMINSGANVYAFAESSYQAKEDPVDKLSILEDELEQIDVYYPALVTRRSGTKE